MRSVSIVLLLAVCGLVLTTQFRATAAKDSKSGLLLLLARSEVSETKIQQALKQQDEQRSQTRKESTENLEKVTESSARSLEDVLDTVFKSIPSQLKVQLTDDGKEFSTILKSVEKTVSKLDEKLTNLHNSIAELTGALTATVGEKLTQFEEFKNLRSLIEEHSGRMNTSKVPLTDGDEKLFKYPSVCTVKYNASSAFSVYRDKALFPELGANWTVFQRRFDGSVDFNRSWSDYENGFGDVEGEHWLGLAKLYHILSTERHELLIELESFDGDFVYAKYDGFVIKNADERYEIKTIGKYTGTAGDSLQYHIGRKFATVDKELPLRKCAKEYSGGGWFTFCFHMHLNGLYRQRASKDQYGISWLSFRDRYSFKASKMMVRPYSYISKL